MLTTVRRIRPRLTPVFALGLGLAVTMPMAADRREADAHEHGVGELSVAIDGNELEIALEGPADNFVGFEYAPRTAAERQAMAAAVAMLRAPAQLFVLPPAAGCRLQSTEVDAPYGPGEDHSGDEHQDADGHSEFSAVYAWRCSRPEALDTIRVQVFARFPGTERLAAQVATPAGQLAVTLKPSAPVLRLRQ
jgi:hypothetical protein